MNTIGYALWFLEKASNFSVSRKSKESMKQWWWKDIKSFISLKNVLQVIAQVPAQSLHSMITFENFSIWKVIILWWKSEFSHIWAYLLQMTLSVLYCWTCSKAYHSVTQLGISVFMLWVIILLMVDESFTQALFSMEMQLHTCWLREKSSLMAFYYWLL